LDHKNVVKQPILQIDIINIISQLAQNVKQQASVAIIGAISDLIKHLRRCLQNSAEASSTVNDAYKLNTELQSALEMCILQLSNKVCVLLPTLFINSFVCLLHFMLFDILHHSEALTSFSLSEVSWILDVYRSKLLCAEVIFLYSLLSFITSPLTRMLKSLI
jgi:hypothetical protein